MGYTVENKKIVIWTSKVFIPDAYPFDDEGENHTFFYENLRAKKELCSCLSRLSDEEKMKIVSDKIGLPPIKFILKSKKSHFKQKHKLK